MCLRLLGPELHLLVAASEGEALRLLRPHPVAVLAVGAGIPGEQARGLLEACRGGPRRDRGSTSCSRAGCDLTLFQELIDRDRIFYLSPEPVPAADLVALLPARGRALAQPRRSPGARRSGAGSSSPACSRRHPGIASQREPAAAARAAAEAVEELVDAERGYCLIYDPAGTPSGRRRRRRGPRGAAGERGRGPGELRDADRPAGGGRAAGPRPPLRPRGGRSAGTGEERFAAVPMPGRTAPCSPCSPPCAARSGAFRRGRPPAPRALAEQAASDLRPAPAAPGRGGAGRPLRRAGCSAKGGGASSGASGARGTSCAPIPPGSAGPTASSWPWSRWGSCSASSPASASTPPARRWCGWAGAPTSQPRATAR